MSEEDKIPMKDINHDLLVGRILPKEVVGEETDESFEEED
jgi:hypothetical protein